MSRRRQPSCLVRLAALVAAAGLALGGVVATPAAPAAAQSGYCPDQNGVTVVVDFQELGGGIVISCAPGDQATGLAALQNSGFAVEGTNRWGLAFICRINGKPGPDSEPCIDTPPATAYWSYWHAPNGGDWTYSQWGATARKPPLGSFEGWSFSMDNPPDGNPPPGVAPVRPDSGSPPPTSGGGGSGDGSGSSGASGDGSGSGSGSGGSGSGPPSSSAGGGTDSGDSRAERDRGDRDETRPNRAPTGATALTPEAGGPYEEPGVPQPLEPTDALDLAAQQSADQAAPSAGGGPTLGTLLGLALVAALIVAAVVTGHRRRARA